MLDLRIVCLSRKFVPVEEAENRYKLASSFLNDRKHHDVVYFDVEEAGKVLLNLLHG